jgi:hypothetical protein
MPLEHSRGGCLDGLPVGDVTLLVLVRPGRAPGQPDDERAAPLQRTDELRADARRGTRDDGYLQTLSTRPAAASWPAASVTVARSLCVPGLSFAVCHVIA